MLQAGVQGVANAAGAVQLLAGPVVNSVSQSTCRVLGIEQFGQGHAGRRRGDGALAKRSASAPGSGSVVAVPALARARGAGRRAGPRGSRCGRGSCRGLAGPAGSRTRGCRRQRRGLGQGARRGGPRRPTWPPPEPEPQIRTAPFADPGNPLAILVPLTAAAMDVVAIGAAVTGWVVRLPSRREPRAGRGPPQSSAAHGVGLGIAAGPSGYRPHARGSTAAVNGLTQAVGTPCWIWPNVPCRSPRRPPIVADGRS